MNQYDAAISLHYNNNNKYHNWPHGKATAARVMRILGLDYNSYIHPAKMAGKWHDAGHQGGDDEGHEERANEFAQRFLRDAKFPTNYCREVSMYIDGTIFSKRGELENYKQKNIADADIALVGGDYLSFVQDSAKLLLEYKCNNSISDQEILDFFRVTQPKFFSYLTGITGDTTNPFLTKEARLTYPHFSRNINILAQDLEENPEKIIDIVRRLETQYT